MPFSKLILELIIVYEVVQILLVFKRIVVRLGLLGRRDFLLKLFVFLKKSRIVSTNLVKMRHVGALNVSFLRFGHFVLLEVIEVLKWLRGLAIRELSLENICVLVEVLDHVVDAVDLVFETVFALLNSVVPQHGEVPLDIGLRAVAVVPHLQVSSTQLACHHVCLAFHDGVLLFQELLSLNKRSES